ncbi:MAG: SRPBCC family protein [Micromonosporaceae bacterium]
MGPDRIEKEVFIAAPIERVWAGLPQPEHIGQWFGQGAPTPVDLRPGGIMYLDHGKNGTFPARIEKVDPPHFLSYRWASAYPGEETTGDNSTLVEFTLTPEAGGTRFSLAESGFASLVIPAHRQGLSSHESHSQRWPDALGGLRRHAEQSAA